MVADRAGNTLRQARRLTADGSVRDFVGRSDRDDLYRIRLSSRSQLSLQLGNVQRGAKVRVEVFSAKGSSGRINRINFSDLTRRQIRQNLTRLGSSSGVIDRTLEAGQYYLRISPQRGESRYRLTVNATPIFPSPVPTPDPTPVPPSPSPSPNPTPSPTPNPNPAPVPLSLGWLRQFGTASNDFAYGTATDSTGNVYVAGTTPNAINTSTTDAFVAKYDANGNQLWLRSFGSAQNSDTAFDIAIDAQGNYYVAGATNINTSNPFSANSDGFVAKFAADGTQLWQSLIDSTVPVPIFGSRSGFDAASGLAIDADGNAYVAGFTKAFPNISQPQAFVGKFNSATGDREWLTEYGGASADAATDVGIDAAGSVYITGIADATLTTDPNEPFTGGDAFVAKFNNSGVQQWDEVLAASEQDYARGIAVTAEGTIYIAGQTDSTLPGQTRAGGRDAFIARYSTDGTLGWVNQFGTSSLDEAQGIAIAPDGSIYISGETNAALSGQTRAGGSDAFFAQFAANGDRLNVQQFGTAQNDESYNLRFDAAGNLYVIGQTEGAFAGQTSAGQYDVFVAKFTP